MTQQPDHAHGHQDGSTDGAAPPAEALQGYPPEAAPVTDDGTEAVAVPGEQTDPDRRLDVFPEDGAADEAAPEDRTGGPPA